jgi:hypothetical protein
MLLIHVPNLLLFLISKNLLLNIKINKFIPSGGEPNIFDSIHVDKRICSLKLNLIARAKAKPNFSTLDGTRKE